MKTKFLVTLDYQTGGVAAFVYANSKSDIQDKFPMGMKIYDLETEEISDYFNESNTLVTDIDNLSGWLKAYYERNKGRDLDTNYI